MTFTRVALAVGVLVVVAFAVLMAIAVGGVFTPLVAVAVLCLLIGAGNLLYGAHSHGAAAQAWVRPAQRAQNRAIDEAQIRARQEREQARHRRRHRTHRQPEGLRRDGDLSG